jgi:hypothetical protein
MVKKFLLLLAIALLSALALAGYNISPKYTPRASLDWSRGKIVGVASLSEQVAMQLDRDGGVYLTWVGLENKLEFARLDDQARVVTEKALDISVATPHDPQLLLGRGGFHLIWRERRANLKGLYYAKLGMEGEVISGPTLISLPQMNADCARMVLNSEGGAEIFWSDNSFESPGIYHLTISPQGEISSPSSQIIPGGMNPSPQIDREGLVHLAWFQKPIYHQRDVYYATFAPVNRALSDSKKIAEVFLMTGQILKGPALGLDKRNAYVFWSVESRARREITSYTYYTSFPSGQPRYRGGMLVEIPRTESPEYQGFELDHIFGVTFHLLAPFAAFATDFVTDPRPLSGQGENLAVAFSARIFTRTTSNLQIALAIFAGGQPRGYQIITKTKSASLSPSIAVDAEGNLHLAWFDTAGFGRLHILYASTSPKVKKVLNRLTIADVIDRTLSLLMAIFSIGAFIPMIAAWLFFPVLWLILFYFSTSEAELITRRAWIALGIAILLGFASKLLVFPGLLSYVPFLNFLPSRLAIILSRWLLPSFLTGIGILVMVLYLKRKRSLSLFSAYFVCALADSILSLAIYVPTLLGYI